jgi:tetratricopeptide (TPR) repeat protein
MSERSEMLQEILRSNPKDAFARYGLAMELSGQGETEASLAEFKTLLEYHPDYAAGYFMAAQLLARVGRTHEAKHFLESGIAAAARTGNAHAQGEMQAMLAELSG